MSSHGTRELTGGVLSARHAASCGRLRTPARREPAAIATAETAQAAK